MAPSPTGFLHLGNARTFLFDYLYAKSQGGTLVLRVEDTDAERSTTEAEEYLVDALHWLGIQWDEGPDIGGPYPPYRQSDRTGYREQADRLLTSGVAYECFCTDEELERERIEQQERGEAPRYSQRCYRLTEQERAEFRAAGRQASVRFHVPADQTIAWNDGVYERTEFNSSDIGDFVILRRDGSPIYNFANVVDDHAMNISTIIRSQSHISNTPRQIMLYEALGWPLPDFAHVPDVLDRDKAKLSKRRGAKGVTDYRDEGYLPEAVVNYLALLGWSSPTDQEILSFEDLFQQFSFDRVQRSNAALDPARLEWFNSQYMRLLPSEEISERALPFLVRAGLLPTDDVTPDQRTLLRRIIPLVQERVRTLAEIPGMVDFFFRDTIDVDPSLLQVKNRSPEDVAQALQKAQEALEQLEPWTSNEILAAVTSEAERLGWKRGDLLMAVRAAETGRKVTPPLTESMEILGRERSIQRLSAARELLDGR